MGVKNIDFTPSSVPYIKKTPPLSFVLNDGVLLYSDYQNPNSAQISDHSLK